MHDFISRIYCVGYSVGTAMGVLAAIGAAMAYMYPMSFPVDFSVAECTSLTGGKHKYDIAELKFNIDFDLTSRFYSNVRLYYAYILAEWNFGADEHKAVVWNQLVHRNNSVGSFKGVQGSFELQDITNHLRGRDVNFSFRIQQVPFVGFFRTTTAKQITYTFPDQYTE